MTFSPVGNWGMQGLAPSCILEHIFSHLRNESVPAQLKKLNSSLKEAVL
jgi:hypothetical protein